MSRVTVAAVGAGVWGSNIVRALKELELEGLLSLEAVVDLDEKRARAVASKYNVRRYLTDIASIPALGIQAATVAVPIDKLVGVGKFLASQGVNIFVEKPVALRPEEIEELIKVVRQANVVAQPGFIVRYDPTTLLLRDELRKRGRPRYVVFKRLSQRPSHRMKFPITYDLMIHDIDLAHFLLHGQSFKVLSVEVGDEVEGVPQLVTVHMKIGSVHTQLIADGLLPVKVREAEVITDDAYIKASFTEGKVLMSFQGGENLLKAGGEEPLRAELRDFINRVKGRRSSIAPTLEDALQACRVAEQIHLMEND